MRSAFPATVGITLSPSGSSLPRLATRIRAAGALLLPVALAIATALGAGGAYAAGPANPGPMQISVNPMHMAPDGSATVTATLSGVSGIGCGIVTIQYQIYQDSSKTLPAVVNWTDLDSGHPTNSVFTATFDGTAITVTAGEVVSFRASFDPNLGIGTPPTSGKCDPSAYNTLAAANSPTADLLIDEESSGATCPNDQTTGVFVAIEQPDGVGMPPPGYTGAWSFYVTVTACEHVYNVSAQGGDNGWGTTKSCTPQANAGLGSTCEKRKANNKSNVWIWQGGNLDDMDEGEKVSAQIVTTGTIKNRSSECGKIKVLNGDWSALYAVTDGGPKMKSDYTDTEATIEVTCF